MEYKIAICNYQFEATNNKKIKESFTVRSGSLIGENVAEILADPTGNNIKTITNHFKRLNKTRSNLNQYKIQFLKVEILRFYGVCMWIHKK